MAECNLRETLVGLEDGDGQRLVPLGLRQLVIEAYETTNARTQRQLLRMARARVQTRPASATNATDEDDDDDDDDDLLQSVLPLAASAHAQALALSLATRTAGNPAPDVGTVANLSHLPGTTGTMRA